MGGQVGTKPILQKAADVEYFTMVCGHCVLNTYLWDHNLASPVQILTFLVRLLKAETSMVRKADSSRPKGV